jgi:hypothetical protein
LPGCRPFSFTWELDWRLRQEPVHNENKYRPFLSPAVEVERKHSGDNGWRSKVAGTLSEPSMRQMCRASRRRPRRRSPHRLRRGLNSDSRGQAQRYHFATSNKSTASKPTATPASIKVSCQSGGTSSLTASRLTASLPLFSDMNSAAQARGPWVQFAPVAPKQIDRRAF